MQVFPGFSPVNARLADSSPIEKEGIAMESSNPRADRRPAGTRGVTRRRVLAGATGAAAAPLVVPASALGADGRAPANSRLNFAVIGMGGRGGNHLGSLLGSRDTQVVGVCDPFQSKREGAKGKVEKRYADAAGKGEYKGCAAVSDFRELVSRPDIDGVAIASPEFWHALHTLGAVKGGKDVYCEKGMTLTHAEGRAVVEAVRKHKRVFQLGTQQRSDQRFRFACELARNGYVGKLQTIQVGAPASHGLPVAQPAPVPPGLDYNMWLGPAPEKPYVAWKGGDLCSYNWYFVYDYCIGWIGSWGVHHIDIVSWGHPGLSAKTLQLEGKATFPKEGAGNTSTAWRVEMTASDGVRLVYSDEKQQEHGVRFIGDKGWVHVTRGRIKAEPASILEVKLKESDERLYESRDQMGNFLECIKSRKDPISAVEGGHVSTTLTNIADIATRVGRKLTWDWSAERFVNDDEANKMLGRPMRAPWAI
jgi:predicted dehydrogenase